MIFSLLTCGEQWVICALQMTLLFFSSLPFSSPNKTMQWVWSGWTHTSFYFIFFIPVLNHCDSLKVKIISLQFVSNFYPIKNCTEDWAECMLPIKTFSVLLKKKKEKNHFDKKWIISDVIISFYLNSTEAERVICCRRAKILYVKVNINSTAGSVQHY